MNRLIRLFLPATFLLLLGAGCLQANPSAENLPPPSTSSAPSAEQTVPVAYLRLDGATADITRDDTTAPGQDDMELDSGDRVTVTSGTAALVYPDAGRSQLDAGSSAVILSQSEQEGNIFDQIRLLSGSIVTRFERLLGPDEHFSVEGAGVVATVRGTAFRLALADGSAEINAMEHQVEISPDEASSTGSVSSTSVVLAEGWAWRGNQDQARKAHLPEMQKLLRKMDAKDKAQDWFKRGLQKIAKDRMKKPDHPVRLRLRSYVPAEFLPFMSRLHDMRLQMMSAATSTR